MFDRLYRITYSQLREPQDRMDAVQNALLKAWSNRQTLRDPKHFETWLIRILINECHNIQRSKRLYIALTDMQEQTEDLYGADHELRDVIARLPEKQRSVIIMYYLEGYKTKEIAAILHIPGDTVRSRLSRARTAMKRLLGEDTTAQDRL